MEKFLVFVDDHVASLSRAMGCGWREVLAWKTDTGYVFFYLATCMSAAVTKEQVQYLRPQLIANDASVDLARLQRNVAAFNASKVPIDDEDAVTAERMLKFIIEPPKVDETRFRTRTRVRPAT